jgi:hypothetical protein
MNYLLFLVVFNFILGTLFGYSLFRLKLNNEVNMKVNERLSDIVFFKQFVEYKQRLLQSGNGLIPKLEKKDLDLIGKIEEDKNSFKNVFERGFK